MNKAEILEYLKTDDRLKIQELFARADAARRKYCGDGVLLRGIVEFSSYCQGSCAYCGLNKQNKNTPRYRMTQAEIIQAAGLIRSSGIQTIVLQSGEDPELDPEWLAEIIRALKTKYALSITLSVGEKTRDTYKLWHDAGADRYLLKIETTDAALYERLHPKMSFANRLRCLSDLQELGYQTGSGIIVGLPYQTPEILAGDILFFASRDFDMIGIGPLIPHQATELKDLPRGSVDLTLRCVALTRILTQNAHLPATTALGSLDKDYRLDGLQAGANVLMPNFTPQPYKKNYEIYPGKRCISEPTGQCALCMESLVESIDRYVDFSRGDSLKKVVI
ncbi:biotin synthase [Candidatus Termititenax persephonae]|uniref:Biotin synthase n=1 Tax=Candidatus Termititenax persephonae TaxID=2218525 RepID=A0A388TFG4_9BACT|nr:biotin synthase [Candidatus Termititenax persephonae]